MCDKIRNQYTKQSLKVPDWLSNPRTLSVTIEPFCKSKKIVDYRNCMELNILKEKEEYVVGVMNHSDHSITPYVYLPIGCLMYSENLCKDPFQNHVISELSPLIQRIVKDPRLNYRLGLFGLNSNSVVWRILSVDRNTLIQKVETEGIASAADHSLPVHIEEKQVIQYSQHFFDTTYHLLLNSFCYVAS